MKPTTETSGRVATLPGGAAPLEGDAWERLEALRLEAQREGAACLVRARLLKQIIKADRDILGIGLDVPHARCLVIGKAALERLVNQEGYLLETEPLPDPALLVAEPAPQDLQALPLEVLRQRVLAAEYHARVHARLAQLAREGGLGDAVLAEVRGAIGQDELCEAFLALEAEDRFLPPVTPASMLEELVCAWLELETFAPGLLGAWFPSLAPERMRRAIELLGVPLDAPTLLGAERAARIRPMERLVGHGHGVHGHEPEHEHGEEHGSGEPYEAGGRVPAAEATDRQAPGDPAVPSEDAQLPADPERARKLTLAAAAAAARGNLVRAIQLRRHAQRLLSEPHERRALTLDSDRDLHALARRLHKALGQQGPSPAGWVRVLRPLVREPGRGFWSRRTRLLYDLQKACVDAERPGVKLDIKGFVLGRGRSPLRRVLADQVPVRVHRHLRQALGRALALSGAEPEVRGALVQALRAAQQGAEARIRELFRPELEATLVDADLVPQNLPEEVAAHKVCEELLDRIVARDYMSFGDLRDALSKNDLKMQDMRSFSKLVLGDALLRADAVLGRRLEGVYRKSPIYMRMLQRMSSLAFGSPVGRALTRFAAIPLLGAFVALEGAKHMVEPALGALGLGHPPDFVKPAVVPLALVILLLIESRAVRARSLAGVKAIGRGLKGLFWDLPKQIIRLPIVHRVLDSYGFAIFRRFVLKPAIPASLILLLMPRLGFDSRRGLVVFGALYLGLSVFLNSRVGRVIEARLGDEAGLVWARIRYRLLPNAFRYIMETSRRFLGMIERLAYTVDEVLRFREGDRRVQFVVKLVGGTVWAGVMYVFQLYMNLLIEPQINPIKHFPVVTVSHKVILPMTKQLIVLFQAPLAPVLGAYVAGTLAGMTVFLLPGLFGFLVWELSANWKLYEASRPDKLPRERVGSHGETMAAFLRPGFHSGTIPKLYARIRKKAIQAFERGEAPAVGKEREDLHHVEQAVTRFFDRDLAYLLERAHGFTQRLAVGSVHLGATQIRVEVLRVGAEEAAPPLVLELAERREHGLIASVRPGFAAVLPPRDQALLREALLGMILRSEADAFDPRGPDGGLDGEAPRVLIPLHGLDVPWRAWVARWEADRREVEAPPLAPSLPLLARAAPS